MTPADVVHPKPRSTAAIAAGHVTVARQHGSEDRRHADSQHRSDGPFYFGLVWKVTLQS
jgi:hypothetical protein